MGIKFNIYQVSLIHIKQVLGSKNPELLERAIHYVEEKTLIYLGDDIVSDLIRQLYHHYLEQLVFDGDIIINLPTQALENSSINQEDWSDLVQDTLVNCFIALFAQNSSFKDYGGYSYAYFKELFEDMRATFPLNEPVLEIIKYLLEGRNLLEKKTIGLDYYTYLTNAEVVILLKSFSLYETREGLTHLQQIDYEQSANPFHPSIVTINHLQSVLETIASQGMDFFVKFG